MDFKIVESPDEEFPFAGDCKGALAAGYILHRLVRKVLNEGWVVNLGVKTIDAELTQVIGSCHVDLLEPGQVSRVVGSTSYFKNIVSGSHFGEFGSHGPVFFDGDITDTKLAILTLSATKDMPISRKEACVL